MAKYELVPNQDKGSETKDEMKSSATSTGKGCVAPPPSAVPIGWPADGMPVGDPVMQRSQWQTGIFSCIGRNDEFYSSDLEVCEFFLPHFMYFAYDEFSFFFLILFYYYYYDVLG